MESHHKQSVSPKDFFLSLGVVAALYGTAVSFIALLYAVINFYFPDIPDYSYYTTGPNRGVTTGIAALFVLFPVFAGLLRMFERDARKHPEKRSLWIRKWLIHLTLFIAGATIAGDLIALIHRFLGGEVTVRFILKVIVIFVVAGSVFSYFYFDIRRAHAGERTRGFFFAITSTAFVVAAIALGFSITGSPLRQQIYRRDELRVEHLSTLTQNIIYYRENFGDVPATLEEVTAKGFGTPFDPQSGDTYTFERISDHEFRLCAVFELPTRPVNGLRREFIRKPSYPMPDPGYEWGHAAGSHCYKQEILPEQLRLSAPYKKSFAVPVVEPE